MESELSPDKNIPPVPIKTYQWEDLRRAREAGGYPWTHLLKAPLQGEITAEDIIRETTPRRSMSREFSRSRTHSPVDIGGVQRILNLDSSPGSSRKHGEEGEDEGVHIPNFSKEVSMDEDDVSFGVVVNRPGSRASSNYIVPVEVSKINVSPKSILKRRVPEQQYNIGVQETREKTKCCHPLVNKIKHLADKTLHKLDKCENEKSPVLKRKKQEDTQEIRQLKSSPGAVRRQKFSAIKLGDSDEMSKTMCIDTPPLRKKKDHIYEDIEESKGEKTLKFSTVADKQDSIKNNENQNDKENENITDKKSIASQDPSLVAEEEILKSEDLVMEKLHKVDKSDKINKLQKLHKMDNVIKEAILLDEEMDQDEPNVDEVFQNQLDERGPNNESPNITITEITDEEGELNADSSQPTTIPIESSPSPSPHYPGKRIDREWSKPSSDHEYEIIEKPPPNIVYTAPSVDEKPILSKNDDELSSTTSLERKYLQPTSDEEETEHKENKEEDRNQEFLNAELIQKDIEDRFFVNTPSTPSRTECEVSTSQVDSSALEQLPLKRDSRSKNAESSDSKIQKHIRESTGKLKTQAGKLKTKIQNIKMPDRPNITLPERPKFKLPSRPKVNLPSRPKLQNLKLSEKWSGARKKFTLPQRPKFNVPELPKFKMPERPKINFPSLGRKKAGTKTSGSVTDVRTATVDFEAKTYPRALGKKQKEELTKTSSSPTLNREDTPPPTFTFTRLKKNKNETVNYIPDSPEQPREYGKIDRDDNNDQVENTKRRYDTTYDFDKLTTEYMGDDDESVFNEYERNPSMTDISPSKQEYTPVITEINNDEFFVRPRGISREDIQVREYLSDETRQAFQVPKNVLALMGSDTNVNEENLYVNDNEFDPELGNADEAMRYSSEDLNDKDDGYYTFPPVRPSRAKRKKKVIEVDDAEHTPYIDESVNASMHFSDIDLGIAEDHHEHHINGILEDHVDASGNDLRLDFSPTTDLHSIHEYANDDVIQYPENIPIESQTLPMPPKRKKKFGKKDLRHSSLNNFKSITAAELWKEPQHQQHNEDIIVYRTEHEYIVPAGENVTTEQSPLPPRRNRSRSSRATSLCDDDRTSHGAESLTLDTNIPPSEDLDDRKIRHESPGYATVDKGYAPPKGERRSLSKTPPARRKSNSSERKYYTVGSQKNVGPDRPPRKKSSTSLMTLDSFNKRSASGDLTQYVEIDEPLDSQRDLKSGDVVNKMKDRPLPPPPRPPRSLQKQRKTKSYIENQSSQESSEDGVDAPAYTDDVVEIEVSTQTDPLPNDVDFELGLDENLDLSMSSSLRDIVDEESIITKSHTKLRESPRLSRPTSRSEKSFKLSDPKISELSKPNIGRTSPTVILVEKRVSSPTRINEKEEMLTEASLTVQHINIEESHIPDVPPLPRPRAATSAVKNSKNKTAPTEERALERVNDATKDVQLDNLVTQRLQVRDLDVGRLNVSELQANKILVSDIEGMTLQVTELDSKSGHLSVSGIEFSPAVIDEIVKKFAEISTSHSPNPVIPAKQVEQGTECPRSVSREEHTQTEDPDVKSERKTSLEEVQTISPPPRTPSVDNGTPPQRPPPPDLTPLLYSYLQDISIPPPSFYPPRSFRERPFTDLHEPHQTPPPPTRRAKRKPPALHSESSSDEGRPRPSPRRMPAPVKAHEPTIVEAGAHFLRVCHSSISRTIRSMFNSFMAYISGTEDKRDAQMALVIFLVLIAGLIMFGLSDSKAIHHHHWDFFNPPDGKQ